MLDGSGVASLLEENWVDDFAFGDGALLGFGHFSGGDAGEDVDTVTLFLRDGDEAGDGFRFFSDDPGGSERDEPAGLGAADLDTVEVSIGAPDLFIELGGGEGAVGDFCGEGIPLADGEILGFVLDAPVADLAIDGGVDFFLGFPNLSGDLGATTDDIEGGPSEEGCDGIEVRGVGFAADAGCLEGDGAAAAEGIADAGDAAKAFLAELGHEFAELGGIGAEVGVDLFPGSDILT